MRGWPSGGLWRHADFLRLWAAQAGSALGGRITRTALPIIAILTVRAAPTEVAVLSALGVAPGVVVGLVAGGRVDRAAKRPLMIGADLVRALLVLTVPAAAWLGALSMPQLYAVAALVGAATTLFQIADASFLPAVVGPHQLVEANARLEATESVAEAAGPGLAGVLVELLTAPVAMVLDALSYLWSAALLGRLTTREAPVAPSSDGAATTLGDIAAGVRACLAHPPVAAILLADAVAYFFGGFFLALYMVVALETLGLSPAAAGLIIGVGGVGAFAGALLAGPLGRAVGEWRAMAIALALGQAAKLLIGLALNARGAAVPLLVVQQLLGDAMLGVYAIHALSLRQRVLPPAVLGRASATFHVVTGLMLPAGALLAGPLAGALGVPRTVWLAAWGGLLAVPVLLVSAGGGNDLGPASSRRGKSGRR